MRKLLIRCSSIGLLMTEPKTKADGILSVGAKTHIRAIASQDIFGVDFEVRSKQMDKGNQMEGEAIGLLNRVRGLDLAKNKERRENEWLTGECDLFDATNKRGHDLKVSWSVATFPIALVDCEDKIYEWQMRGYMALWDANEWEVNYALLSTPEHLCAYEPPSMHFVDHIPEHMRLTTWVVKRDLAKEALMAEKVMAAREYYAKVIEEFANSHIQTVKGA